MDPRIVTMNLLGPIDWQNEIAGFCQCPGEAFHTSRTGKKDCRVNVDGVPTIHCFHSHCQAAVREANRSLRRELGARPWQLELHEGVLRNGDLLRCATEAGGKAEIVRGESFRQRPGPRRQESNEKLVLESLKVHAERFRHELFDYFRWTLGEILEESPLLVSERDPEDQFQLWLNLWPTDSIVWIGDVFSSGKPEHRAHFRSVAEWRSAWPVAGNFTCASSFKPGSWRRSNDSLSGHRFMVIESDTLGKDEVGAVFAYLNRRLKFNLHAIIDTAGKSLHAWFDAPRDRLIEERLKAVLVVFGCDPKVLTYSQPVRVPGALREGRLQRLIWLKE